MILNANNTEWLSDLKRELGNSIPKIKLNPGSFFVKKHVQFDVQIGDQTDLDEVNKYLSYFPIEGSYFYQNLYKWIEAQEDSNNLRLTNVRLIPSEINPKGDWYSLQFNFRYVG